LRATVLPTLALCTNAAPSRSLNYLHPSVLISASTHRND
ncbi:MAG: hypothetical protein ACI9S9_005111, partial [Planctomycetota bacterium]